MPGFRLDRLFHTLVVVGAALPGCGARSPLDDPPESTGSAASGSSCASCGSVPADAMVDAPTCSPPQLFCADYTSMQSCHCDPTAPLTPSDCANPYQFRCEANVPAVGFVGQGQGYGCSCDLTALTPTGCAQPQQFTCQSYDPYFSNCTCNPVAPLQASDCQDAGAPYFGQYCFFRCQSQSPQYGCRCDCVVPIR